SLFSSFNSRSRCLPASGRSRYGDAPPVELTLDFGPAVAIDGAGWGVDGTAASIGASAAAGGASAGTAGAPGAGCAVVSTAAGRGVATYPRRARTATPGRLIATR